MEAACPSWSRRLVRRTTSTRNDTILFLEDVNAKPYQVDRMLMQLKLAGKLRGVKGIVFGEMLDCAQSNNQGYTLQEVVMRIVGTWGFRLRMDCVPGT